MFSPQTLLAQETKRKCLARLVFNWTPMVFGHTLAYFHHLGTFGAIAKSSQKPSKTNKITTLAKKTATTIMHKIRTLFLSRDIEKSSLIALRCGDARSRDKPRHRANLVILCDKNSVLILCIIVVAVFFFLARVEVSLKTPFIPFPTKMIKSSHFRLQNSDQCVYNRSFKARIVIFVTTPPPPPCNELCSFHWASANFCNGLFSKVTQPFRNWAYAIPTSYQIEKKERLKIAHQVSKFASGPMAVMPYKMNAWYHKRNVACRCGV